MHVIRSIRWHRFFIYFFFGFRRIEYRIWMHTKKNAQCAARAFISRQNRMVCERGDRDHHFFSAHRVEFNLSGHYFSQFTIQTNMNHVIQKSPLHRGLHAHASYAIHTQLHIISFIHSFNHISFCFILLSFRLSFDCVWVWVCVCT